MNKDWLVLLQNAVRKSTMTEVADKLGYSVATACLVLMVNTQARQTKLLKKWLKCLRWSVVHFYRQTLLPKNALDLAIVKHPPTTPTKCSTGAFANVVQTNRRHDHETSICVDFGSHL